MISPCSLRRCGQTEFGDIYRVTLKYDQDKVDEVVCKYFDTVPPSMQHQLAVSRHLSLIMTTFLL